MTSARRRYPLRGSSNARRHAPPSRARRRARSSRNVSHETVRISLRSPCSSSSGQVALGQREQLERRRGALVGRLAERLAREREQADAVGHLLPDQRHRHDEVLVRAQARARGQRQVGRERLARAARTARRRAGARRCGAATSRRRVVARAGRLELREELGLRPDRRVVRRVGAVDAAARARPRRAACARRASSRATCRSGRSGGAARRPRAGRRSRSARARPARRDGARAGARGRARTAAPRGRCGRGSGRARSAASAKATAEVRVREVVARQARVQLDAARARVEAGFELGLEALARLAARERHDAPATRLGGGDHLGVDGGVARAARRLERERPAWCVTPPASIDASSVARSSREPSDASAPRWACTSTSPSRRARAAARARARRARARRRLRRGRWARRGMLAVAEPAITISRRLCASVRGSRHPQTPE